MEFILSKTGEGIVGFAGSKWNIWPNCYCCSWLLSKEEPKQNFRVMDDNCSGPPGLPRNILNESIALIEPSVCPVCTKNIKLKTVHWQAGSIQFVFSLE